MSCRDLAEWSNIGLFFLVTTHDDVIKWKHFPRYWPFVGGIHRPPVDSHHKGQWRGALMFSLICAWTNSWTNNRDAVDLRRHRADYDVIIMHQGYSSYWRQSSWWRHQMDTFSALQALCAGIHRSAVNSPHKGQWREALMLSFICAWINGWVNYRHAGDLRHHRSHDDVSAMLDAHILSCDESSNRKDFCLFHIALFVFVFR